MTSTEGGPINPNSVATSQTYFYSIPIYRVLSTVLFMCNFRYTAHPELESANSFLCGGLL